VSAWVTSLLMGRSSSTRLHEAELSLLEGWGDPGIDPSTRKVCLGLTYQHDEHQMLELSRQPRGMSTEEGKDPLCDLGKQHGDVRGWGSRVHDLDNLPGHLIAQVLLLPWQVSHLEGEGCEEEATQQLGVGLVSHDHPQAAGKGQLDLPQRAEGP